jgi:hypothetical protein
MLLHRHDWVPGDAEAAHETRTDYCSGVDKT